MKTKILLLLLALLMLTVGASAYADPNCEYCEYTPKYIEVTFSNIILYSGRCETAECGECSIITTDDPNNPINRTYILKQDEPNPYEETNPCRWSYVDPCGPRSIRSECKDYEYTAVATGLEIEVIKGDYGPNSVSVSLNSKLECWVLGLASYFWAVTDAEDGCVKVTNVPNIGTGTGILDCCCSLWPASEWPPYAPPWYVGLGGTVTIREAPNFGDFNGDGIVNFKDFSIFAENWLVEF